MYYYIGVPVKTGAYNPLLIIYTPLIETPAAPLPVFQFIFKFYFFGKNSFITE